MKYDTHPYCIYVRACNANGSNNLGFSSTIDTTIEKRKKRVICIGGSATELCFGKDTNNTYPKHLQDALLGEYEVLNAGCCCYTTAEMLINLSLRLLDFKPNFVVVYEAINDVLYGGMVGEFKSDYSHSRVNVGFHTNTSACITGHINRRPFTPASVYPQEAIDTYRRNIETIRGICRAHGIVPVVVRYNYNPQIVNQDKIYPLDEVHLSGCEAVFLDGLKRTIASVEYDVTIDDMVAKDFVDSCHFSETGMTKMARRIGFFIKNYKKEQ